MVLKKLIPNKIKTAIKMTEAYFISSFNYLKGVNYKCSKNTKRCFNNKKSQNYKYEYFGKNTPICCATNLYKTLIDTTNILEKNNIEYFISFGTLLGSVRHGGLIPWDTDVDIVINENDKDKVFKILTKELDSSYLVSDDGKDGVSSLIRVNFSKTNSLHVDIFTYFEDNKEIVFGYNRRFKKESISPLIKLKFYENFLYAPKNYAEQLEQFYGANYMKYAYKQWAFNKSKFEITDYKPAEIEQQL